MRLYAVRLRGRAFKEPLPLLFPHVCVYGVVCKVELGIALYQRLPVVLITVKDPAAIAGVLDVKVSQIGRCFSSAPPDPAVVHLTECYVSVVVHRFDLGAAFLIGDQNRPIHADQPVFGVTVA